MARVKEHMAGASKHEGHILVQLQLPSRYKVRESFDFEVKVSDLEINIYFFIDLADIWTDMRYWFRALFCASFFFFFC